MVPVHRIGIKGFRSLKSISWEPDRLNVLIGPNGSGKSNLLRGIELLRESALGRLRDSVLAEGGLRQLMWDHRGEEISWTLKLGRDILLEYDLALSPLLLGGGFRVVRESLTSSEVKLPGEPLYLIKRGQGPAVSWNERERKLVPPADTVPPDATMLSALGLFVPTPIMAFRMALQGFSIFHDLVTHRGAAVRAPSVTRVEELLAATGDNLVPVLHTLYTGHREFERSVDAGMRAAFGEDFEKVIFSPAGDQRIQLQIRWKGLTNPVSAMNLSDGTLRFLMLLTVLANPDSATFIAIDEPETGLHPRMLPIIAEFAASASERTTVVLTTHSPELLDAFPSDCVPTTTVAECVEGETILSKLDPDQLKRWLKEYSLGKLFKSGELEAIS